MDTKFNLKEVNETSENQENKKYNLKFVNDKTEKTILLSGKGKLRVAVNI